MKKHIPTFEEFVNESSLNEGDMTNHYDGFLVLDSKTKKLYKFKYVKGTSNVKVENSAIDELMKITKEPRANFMVHGFVRKGEWSKSDYEDINEGTFNESSKFSYGKITDKLTAIFTKETGIELGDKVKQEGQSGKFEVTRIWAPADKGAMNPGLHIELTQISGGSSFGHFMAMDDDGKLTERAKKLKKI